MEREDENSSALYGSRLLALDKEWKIIFKEGKLEECSEAERDMFMCNMRAREALLSALPENEYSQEKTLQTSHEN